MTGSLSFFKKKIDLTVFMQDYGFYSYILHKAGVQ